MKEAFHKTLAIGLEDLDIGKPFDYDEILRIKPVNDLWQNDRLIFRMSPQHQLPKLIILQRDSKWQLRDPGRCIVETDSMIGLIQAAIDEPLPPKKELEPIPLVADQVKEEKKIPMDDDEDIFEEEGRFNVNEALEQVQVPSGLPQRENSFAASSMVDEFIRTARERLDDKEMKEEMEAKLSKKFLESVHDLPAAKENPFSIRNASLVPLKHKPIEAHHIKQSAVREVLANLDMSASGPEDVDAEYGIDMEGEAVPKNSKIAKKRRRGDISENVEAVMKKMEESRQSG